MEENNINQILLAMPARAILWYPISDFFFGIVQRNEFIYFYRNDFPIFWVLIGGVFRTMKHCVHRRYPAIQFFLKFYFCVTCVNNFMRLAMFYLKHLYSKTLDVSMMNRERPIFFQELFIRWQFVILIKSQISFIFHLNT